MIGQRIQRRRRSPWTLLVIAMAILIVLLGIANLGFTIFQALDRPPTPAPKQLLYVSTFDAYNSQWSQFEGQVWAKIENGQLQLGSDAVNEGAYSELDRMLTDFDARVDIQWLDARINYSYLGVLFRIQDPRNHYRFEIRGDGFYRVALLKNGVHDTLSQWHFSPYIYTESSRVNQLRVVGKETTFKFYINGQLMPLCLKGTDRNSTWEGPGKCMSNNRQISESLTDATFGQGKFGLGGVADEPGLRAGFDNVLILGPE